MVDRLLSFVLRMTMQLQLLGGGIAMRRKRRVRARESPLAPGLLEGMNLHMTSDDDRRRKSAATHSKGTRNEWMYHFLKFRQPDVRNKSFSLTHCTISHVTNTKTQQQCVQLHVHSEIGCTPKYCLWQTLIYPCFSFVLPRADLCFATASSKRPCRPSVCKCVTYLPLCLKCNFNKYLYDITTFAF